MTDDAGDRSLPQHTSYAGSHFNDVDVDPIVKGQSRWHRVPACRQAMTASKCTCVYPVSSGPLMTMHSNDLPTFSGVHVNWPLAAAPHSTPAATVLISSGKLCSSLRADNTMCFCKDTALLRLLTPDERHPGHWLSELQPDLPLISHCLCATDAEHLSIAG